MHIPDIRRFVHFGFFFLSMELFPSLPLKNSDDHQSISPVRAEVAFVGKSNTLWRTCETLVNRMCRLESVVQTMKLNMFRLQTEKELNPKHAGTSERNQKTRACNKPICLNSLSLVCIFLKSSWH